MDEKERKDDQELHAAPEEASPELEEGELDEVAGGGATQDTFKSVEGLDSQVADSGDDPLTRKRPGRV